MLHDLHFEEPWMFLLLLLLPLLWWHWSRQSKVAHLKFSQAAQIKKLVHSRLLLLSYLGGFWRSLALIAAVIVAARPQLVHSESRKKIEGLDIILAVDASGSMRALDFELNGERKTRLDVAKQVLADFIDNRPDDRLGLVVFGTHAFTVAPLTYDHEVLKFFLDGVEIGVAGDQTAIGEGMATSIKRLKDLKAKSRLIILLTDGENTAGSITPATAIELAKTYQVKVYTIAMGTDGIVPVADQYGRIQRARFKVDRALLENIAQQTQARYFNAEDTTSLQQVYQTIDQLEKSESEAEIYRHYDEAYVPFAFAALLFLVFELLFNMSRSRRVP